MSQGAPRRRRHGIEAKEAEKARKNIKGLFQTGKGLKELETDELVVLLADVVAEIQDRGGSDLVPRGMQHRLKRVVE